MISLQLLTCFLFIFLEVKKKMVPLFYFFFFLLQKPAENTYILPTIIKAKCLNIDKSYESIYQYLSHQTSTFTPSAMLIFENQWKINFPFCIRLFFQDDEMCPACKGSILGTLTQHLSTGKSEWIWPDLNNVRIEKNREMKRGLLHLFIRPRVFSLLVFWL